MRTGIRLVLAGFFSCVCVVVLGAAIIGVIVEEREHGNKSKGVTEPGWVYEIVVAPPETFRETMNATTLERDCRLRDVVATKRRVIAVFECWSE